MNGLSFPLTFKDGKLAAPSLEESIESSIKVILAYSKGERDFIPDFYTGIYGILSQPADSISANQVQILIARALMKFEPRITLKAVNTSYQGSDMLVSIIATINKTQKEITIKI